MKLDRTLISPLFFLASRGILGFLFIVASIDKIANPSAFAAAVALYQLVSPAISLWIATYLPWIELLIGLGLLIGIYRKGSSLISSLLLLIFTVAAISALLRGLDISCGCFTQDPALDKIGLRKIAENILLLALSLTTLTARRDPFALEETLPHRS